MAYPVDDAFVWPPPHWAEPLGLVTPDVSSTVGTPVPIAMPQELGHSLDLPAIPVAAPASVAVPPPVPVEPLPPVATQPGLGIPVETIDQAAAPIDPAPVEQPPADLQPGLGIPTDTIDAVGAALQPKPFDVTSWKDRVDLAHRDPMGYAQLLADEDAKQHTEVRKLLDPVATQDRNREEQNHRDLMDANAAADRLAHEVRNTEINPNRFRENQSTLQGIASFLSVVVGGLYQARKGGPNIGLQMLDHAIDRDIAAQESNLANKRSLIADLRSSGMNQFQAREAYRVAALKRAHQDVLTTMQDYDPAGTAARNLAQQALELESRMAQSAEAARRNKLDEWLKVQKNTRENAESLSKISKEDLERAKLMGALGGGGGAAAKPAAELVTPDEVRRRYPDLPPEAIPTTPLSEVALSKHLEQVGKGQGIGDKSRSLQMGDLLTGKPLLQEDGKTVWRAPNPEVHAIIVKKATGTRDLIDLQGKVEALREIEGGADKFTDPDTQAEYDRLVNKSVFAWAAANNISTADDDSFQKAKVALYGKDPSGYRVGNVVGRIRRAIGESKESLNAAMRGPGLYTGPALRFPNVSKPPETESQVRIRRLTSSKSGTSASVQDVLDTKKRDYEPIEADKADIDALAAPALAPNASWDDYNTALTNLRAVLDKTDSLSIRQYGIKTLQQLQQRAPGGAK